MNNNIVTVEISMYPLVKEYEAHIIPFIQDLKSQKEILVRTNAMSTFIQGPFDVVWETLGKSFSNAFEGGIAMSNVMKIIPRKLPLENTWLEF